MRRARASRSYSSIVCLHSRLQPDHIQTVVQHRALRSTYAACDTRNDALGSSKNNYAHSLTSDPYPYLCDSELSILSRVRLSSSSASGASSGLTLTICDRRGPQRIECRLVKLTQSKGHLSSFMNVVHSCWPSIKVYSAHKYSRKSMTDSGEAPGKIFRSGVEVIRCIQIMSISRAVTRTDN